MVSKEEDEVISQHCEKLACLISALKGISPANSTVSSLELIVRNIDGSSQEVTFDVNEIDTYLLFNGLSELAQTREEHLRSKLKENENVRKNFSTW